MGREKFLLDLAWLIVVGAVLVLGDYRRRDEQIEPHAEFKMLPHWVGQVPETAEASLVLPLPMGGRSTF